MLVSIKTALTAMFAVLAVVTGLQGAIIFVQLAEAERNIDSVAEMQLPSLDAIRDISAAVLRVRSKEFRLILSDPNQQVIHNNSVDLADDEAELLRARHRYEALIASPEESQIYQRMSETLGVYMHLTEPLPALMEAGKTDEAQQLLLKPWLRVLFYSVDSQLQHAIAINEARARTHSTLSAQALKHARLVGLFSAVLAGIIAASAVAYSYLRILKPLSGVTRALNQLARGNTRANHVLTQRRDEIGEIGQAVEVFRNAIIRMRQAEAERLQTQLLVHNIAASTPDGIVAFDDAGVVTFWNHAAEHLLGVEAAQMIGKTIDQAFAAKTSLVAPQDAVSPGLEGMTIETELKHSNGDVIPVELSYSRWEEDGRTMCCAILRDIRSRKQDEAVLNRLAHTDALTGLPNRLVLTARMAAALRAGRRFAVLLLDLDHFKQVNDVFGHQTGDEILKMAGERIVSCIGHADTVTRIGGDEFIAILDGVADPLQAGGVADAIARSLGEPFVINGRSIHLGASIGIALAPNHGAEPDDLIACADLALYAVKAQGRHNYRLFTPELRGAATRESNCRQELPRAIENGEFTLFYQPQIRLSDGALLGAEALIRWQHPTLGLVAPDVFIHVLEASHHAEEVGDWVIRTACRQAAQWRALQPDFRMSVNLSIAHFRTGRLADTVADALQTFGLPGSALEVEITEHVILRHDENIVSPLHALQKLGVSIAFDDYGTGFASLSLLKRFPLNRLKIDRSFVQTMGESAADAAIIKTILTLGSSLGLEVIAEGIETVDQAERLKQSGCAQGQGYLFGRPVGSSDFELRFPRLSPRRPELRKII